MKKFFYTVANTLSKFKCFFSETLSSYNETSDSSEDTDSIRLWRSTIMNISYPEDDPTSIGTVLAIFWVTDDDFPEGI